MIGWKTMLDKKEFGMEGTRNTFLKIGVMLVKEGLLEE